MKVSLFFVASSVIVLTACGGNPSRLRGVSDEFPLGQVEIQGLSESACAAPTYIAKEKGFFAEEGLDVTLVSGTFETDKAGLASGKYPVSTGDFQFFPSIHEGLDIKLVDGLHQGCIKVLAPPWSEIEKPADLAGKRIGVDEIGGSPMAVTTVLLANVGINPISGVSWIPYPKDQLELAVEKGEVDAVALWDPFATVAERKGYIVLCDIGTDPLFAGKYCCFLFASGKQIKENPERIAALVRAFRKAAEWIAAYPDEAARISIEKGYIPADDTAFVSALLQSYKYHAHHDETTRHQAGSDAAFFVSELKKTGFLPSDIDADAFVQKLYFDVLTEQKETPRPAAHHHH
ncbi:MAG: ABC transporter substrate-binding protein [Tannerellaceae bacterium]|jgi:NitT/TauT family transport system substrate-binding protein|nr:ABC transporter substrate-binding protein [Tannerellaceae bacterium]